MKATLVLLRGALFIADLQDLTGSTAFRVGEVGTSDEGATERNGVGDTQDATDGADESRGPVRKAGPEADHDQAWEHEDDGG